MVNLSLRYDVAPLTFNSLIIIHNLNNDSLMRFMYINECPCTAINIYYGVAILRLLSLKINYCDISVSFVVLIP